jgi:hypothetical protein
VKKPELLGAYIDFEAAAKSSKFAEQHPLLFEHLAAIRYEDGSARKTSSLMVLIEDGCTKVCLNDRQEGRSCWLSGASLEQALFVLEERLADNTIEWRKSNWAPGGKKR